MAGIFVEDLLHEHDFSHGRATSCRSTDPGRMENESYQVLAPVITSSPTLLLFKEKGANDL